MAPSSKTTTYFGYGSNLWLHQMRARCQTSTYLGVARLNGYKWIINDRGYANVVELSTSSHAYADVVYGLVYSLEADDEKRLDRNEGVPIAYTKEALTCDFWKAKATLERVDVSKPPTESCKMLVYIDRNRVADDKPKEEYVIRMNKGIDDAIEQGVPKGYIDKVLRKFIPAEGDADEAKRKSAEEKAHRQAVDFVDESGVY